MRLARSKGIKGQDGVQNEFRHLKNSDRVLWQLYLSSLASEAIDILFADALFFSPGAFKFLKQEELQYS